MSFASDTKNELARNYPEKKCCTLAEIAGFIRVAGSIKLLGRDRKEIVLSTENPAIARHYIKLIQDYFEIDTSLQIGPGTALNKGHKYYVSIGWENKSDKILRETGIMQVREGFDVITDGIYDDVIKKKCCKKAYLKGLFMGIGTINNPANSYNLEFVCNTEGLSRDLRRMINTFVDLSAKVFERRKKFVVYMKNFNYISDTLAIMGAHSQVLKMQDIKINKELKSEAARMVNCDNANIDRTTAASEKQVASINKIDELSGLACLPEGLRMVAELRLEHPEVNLTQLGEMCDPPLTKSGVSKRLRRIVELSQKL